MVDRPHILRIYQLVSQGPIFLPLHPSDMSHFMMKPFTCPPLQHFLAMQTKYMDFFLSPADLCTMSRTFLMSS